MFWRGTLILHWLSFPMHTLVVVQIHKEFENVAGVPVYSEKLLEKLVKPSARERKELPKKQNVLREIVSEGKDGGKL